MAAQAQKIARSIKAPAGKSTVANLAERTTSAVVRAARPAALATGNNYTGQYLYERFVGNDEADVAKMDIVRDMVGSVDTASFKSILADMVKIAKDAMDAAGAKPADGSLVSARYKTTQNHQTVMRVAYGALKFAPEQLAKLGVDKTTGYQTMRVLGNKALDMAGLKWDGSKAESADARAARRAQDAETKAMLLVQKDHPRKDGENRADYFARIDKLVEKQVNADKAEQHAKRIADLVAKLKRELGDDLPEVVDALLSNEEQPEPVKH
jgi:hypothetical protein